MTGPIDDVVREILVRQLDAWGPAALHRAKRATFVQAYGGPVGGLAEAAIRVFDEFTDLLRGRRLTLPVVGPSVDGAALDRVVRELDRPSGLDVHPVTGGVDALPAVLSAASAGGAPLLAFVDATTGPPPSAAALTAIAKGKPAELLLVLGAAGRGFDHRAALAAAGFPLVADVELVARDGAGGAPGARDGGGGAPGESDGDGGAPGAGGSRGAEAGSGGGREPGRPATRGAAGGDEARLVAFATGSGKSLDAFKDAMWAVDEYAGVRYRDPHDPEGHLLDISERPHPGPLRRELLAHLDTVGRATVTELRQFTVTDTVYRSADATRVITALLTGGQIRRDPPSGRLAGDVLIEPTGTAA